jgi:hypoxia up-regulated 1
VESLFQDIDFKAKFTRRELEEIFKEFEQQYLEPINAALEMSQISLENLDRILLMGAGTRVPRLQEILGQFFSGFVRRINNRTNTIIILFGYFSKEIGRNLNTDEAVALGAVYQAARESKKFIVKRFDVVDYKPPETESPVKLMDEQEVAQAKTM